MRLTRNYKTPRNRHSPQRPKNTFSPLKIVLADDYLGPSKTVKNHTETPLRLEKRLERFWANKHVQNLVYFDFFDENFHPKNGIFKRILNFRICPNTSDLTSDASSRFPSIVKIIFLWGKGFFQECIFNAYIKWSGEKFNGLVKFQSEFRFKAKILSNLFSNFSNLSIKALRIGKNNTGFHCLEA